MVTSYIIKYLLILFATLLVFGGLFMAFPADASHDDPPTFHSPAELDGYAWSPNIGWISFNCSNDSSCGASDYKVIIRPNKRITGYAWSANVGWIRFGSFGSCPEGTCISEVDTTTNQFSGWARALNYGNGWDGWISLNCLNTSGGCSASPYRVTANSSGGFGSNSYAWGSSVIGWTNFSLITFTPPCSITPSCTSDWSGIVTTDMWCAQTISACGGTDQCSGAPPTCGTISLSGDLNVSPLLVRNGSTVTVSWSGVPPTATCEVRSSDGNGPYISGDSSSPITYNTTDFTLYCVPGGGGPEVEVDVQTVKKLPTIFES